MNDGGPLLEELDVAEGVEVGDAVDELEVAVAVGERVEERLGELLCQWIWNTLLSPS
jgi:hypothetical protein